MVGFKRIVGQRRSRPERFGEYSRCILFCRVAVRIGRFIIVVHMENLVYASFLPFTLFSFSRFNFKEPMICRQPEKSKNSLSDVVLQFRRLKPL